MPSDLLTVIAQDSSGNSWIGSQDSGLIQLDATGQFTSIHWNALSPRLDNKVFSIAVDEHENVWHMKGDQLFV